MSVSSLTRISPWVTGTKYFQDRNLWNKAVLELVGVDGPMIALARNPQERKEIMFRQAIILLAAFIIAPLHGLLFLWAFSKGFKVNASLMRLSYKHLTDGTVMNQAIASLKLDNAPIVKQGLEATRINLIKAKTHLLTFDMMTEALIFGSLGWMKNWFGRLITGKNQFTGEMGAVSEEQLDQLYAQKQKKSRFQKFLPYVTTALAIIAPLVTGFLVQRAMLRNSTGQFKVIEAAWNGLKKHANKFDYKDGYLLGLLPLLIIGVIGDLGEFIAGRSDNEKWEALLKRIPLTIVFCGGDIAFRKVLSKLSGQKLYTSVGEALEHTAEQSLHAQNKAGKSAAWLYVASFLFNTLAVSALIFLNNRWTIGKVKKAAAELSTKTAIPTQQPVGIPYSPPILRPTLFNPYATTWYYNPQTYSSYAR